jgi:hypothetical protein
MVAEFNHGMPRAHLFVDASAHHVPDAHRTHERPMQPSSFAGPPEIARKEGLHRGTVLAA